MGSVPANSDSDAQNRQNMPSFCRWRFEMKLGPLTNFFYEILLYPSGRTIFNNNASMNSSSHLLYVISFTVSSVQPPLLQSHIQLTCFEFETKTYHRILPFVAQRLKITMYNTLDMSYGMYTPGYIRDLTSKPQCILYILLHDFTWLE